MKIIKLELNLGEVNKILESLSNMPYKEVYAIIDNIRAQAAPQIKEAEQKEPEQQEASKKDK